VLRQSALLAQSFWSPHLVAQLTPQSASDSVPFFTPSEHVAASQTPLVHVPLAQSALAKHFLLFAHLVEHVPPQSVSDSAPLRVESEHVHVPALHPMYVVIAVLLDAVGTVVGVSCVHVVPFHAHVSDMKALPV